MHRHADVRHAVRHRPLLKLGNGQFAILLVILFILFSLIIILLQPYH